MAKKKQPTEPAAPAASETGSEQAAVPDVQADAAAPSPEPEGSAPPAPADAVIIPVEGAVAVVTPSETEPGKVDVVLVDTTQELLEKQAEETQPKPPVLDRVLSRLAAAIDEPSVGYASTSPEVSLPGELAELNAKLFNAMLAEGVPCSRQGDTLRFLLEQIGESVRRGF